MDSIQDPPSNSERKVISTGILNLADELLVMICTHLCGHCQGCPFPNLPVSKDLGSLSLVSRRLNGIAEPFLYHAFSSQSSGENDYIPYTYGAPWKSQSNVQAEQVATFLRAIISRPDRAANVRLLDLTSMHSPTTVFDDTFEVFRRTLNVGQFSKEQSQYIHMLQLIRWLCLNVETLSYRCVCQLTVCSHCNDAIRKLDWEKELDITKAKRRYRETAASLRHLTINIENDAGPLSFMGLDASLNIQQLRSLTITGGGDSGKGEIHLEIWIKTVKSLALRELNLLHCCVGELSSSTETLIQACQPGLQVLRCRIPDDEFILLDDVSLDGVIGALARQQDTLEYLEYSDYIGEARHPQSMDLSKFKALKALKVRSRQFWARGKPKVSQMEAWQVHTIVLPEPSDEAAIVSIDEPGSSVSPEPPRPEPFSWLPPNITSLHLAMVPVWDGWVVHDLAVSKTRSYPQLKDLWISIAPKLMGGGEFDECDPCCEKHVLASCAPSGRSSGVFERLKASKDIAAAGVTIRRLQNQMFWDNPNSCEEVDFC